jgi:NADPH-dependent glutamate synthase beta subunit-like oxidoreductase/NAD(P)H-flavin reductase
MTAPDSALAHMTALDTALAGFGLAFADLYDTVGLRRLDAQFLARLAVAEPALAARLSAARQGAEQLPAKDESALLLELSPYLEQFIADLFGIRDEVAALAAAHGALSPLYEVKRQFVQRRAGARYKPEQAAALDADSLRRELTGAFGGRFDELTFARHVARWLTDEEAHKTQLETALRYAAWALLTAAGREYHHAGVLFKAPAKIDPHQLLVNAREESVGGVRQFTIRPEHIRRREGFRLTDSGTDLTGALDQIHYCILCHNQGKDSCAKGLREKPPAAQPDKIVFKKTVFGVPLAGCPLEEKISEFHTAKARGLALAALALITVDNPMAAATGHRICNDCMKSCIYQKQEPVNIPQAETRTLKDVLDLPYGFEIYSLLTRWNPLNLRRPYPRAASGYKVLVVGMGPAGFTLAHHLMNDGHTVVGIDGLKIEALPPGLAGVGTEGARTAFRPIRNTSELIESLDDRVMAGFGGVAEYGITVRWDKNFLKLVRLLVERRREFALFGGVRFGGTFTLEEALALPEQDGLGFDHVALAMGAGKPTTLDIPNGLARGVRTASDFLMALQLTGAAKSDSIANMQLRLPVVVIGGGLTAIDTATESLAYYAVQVEKFLSRYEEIARATGEALVRADWSEEETEVAEEYLRHARALRAERAAAVTGNRPARLIELLQSWGGVSIAYRRRLIDSPSYTLNHEEVEKALEEGIRFCEGLTPVAIATDAREAVRSIRFRRQEPGADGAWIDAGEAELPARMIFIAAGTQPNTVLAREDNAHFVLDGKYFQACDEAGEPVRPQYSSAKPEHADVLLSRQADGRFVSFFGDLHPSYFGNVVKAMASAKQGYPRVSRVLAQRAPATTEGADRFLARLRDGLSATVAKVQRLTPTIVEVVVRAPLAARHFQPGQFYRLQNFETSAPRVEGTRMQMEGLALTGAWVDREAGLVSTIALEMGGSADLCAVLQPGEPVVLMGPTGSPTEIEPGETVVLAGGGLGNAVLFSIGQALRARGSKVIYFAGYKKMQDRYKVAEIEQAADRVVWCCDEAPGFSPTRPGDLSFVGNIVQAMEAYGAGRLGPTELRLDGADRLIVIGSDRMMAAVKQARHGVLAAYLDPAHKAVASVNSPMQCMMKEICAQCLQAHRDPATGRLSYVFSCFNQDQALDRVDFPSLSERLKQNSLQEKLTAAWIRYCMPALRKERSMV